MPLGVAFAIGVDRWRTRPAAAANFVMVFSFVIPELIFGVALFFVFNTLFTSIHLGTLAEVARPGDLEPQLAGHHRPRPAGVDRAPVRRGGRRSRRARRLEAVRRVLLPMLAPAIFASAVLVFSGVIDDFVLVDLLSSSAATQPMSVIIYSNTHGGNGGPALNALATLMLALSFVVAILGYFGYRWMTRGERASSRETMAPSPASSSCARVEVAVAAFSRSLTCQLRLLGVVSAGRAAPRRAGGR